MSDVSLSSGSLKTILRDGGIDIETEKEGERVGIAIQVVTIHTISIIKFAAKGGRNQ